MDNVIELINISKYFGDIKANDNVNISLKKGEIHAILGENGAGKSTLMSILFGLYAPDKGEIRVKGEKVTISNPNVAKKFGIGMVHQHFKLVECFTVVENIILGDEPTNVGIVDRKSATKKVVDLSNKYGLNVDPDALISDISVGMQQRVEILKMLYRDAEILIFDEPTAVLTPQEIEELIEIMRLLVKEGKSILLITHKLKEIKEVADRFSVLRRGQYIDTQSVASTSEEEMAEMMVGRKVNFSTEKSASNPKDVVLEVQNLSILGNKGLDVVKNVSLNVRAGEIHGIVGIEGNGQTDLIYGITGLSTIKSGKVILNGNDMTKASIKDRLKNGIGHIPEDRHKHGLVLEFSLEDNLVIHNYNEEPYSKSGIINKGNIRKNAERLIEEYDIRSSKGPISISRQMSGGNQQKAIIAREIDLSPSVLLAVQPTRGLDIGAIEGIHNKLIEERDKGKAILLVSLEIEEVLDICDRISIMYDGMITGEVIPSETDENEIGLYMSGSKKEDLNE
ncbi:MAG: ABC transporter ATP-binding protein [Bacilli bacterium]